MISPNPAISEPIPTFTTSPLQNLSRVERLLISLNSSNKLVLENNTLTLQNKTRKWYSIFLPRGYCKETQAALEAILDHIDQTHSQKRKEGHVNPHFENMVKKQIPLKNLYQLFLDSKTLQNFVKDSTSLSQKISQFYLGEIKSLNFEFFSTLNKKSQKFFSLIAKIFDFFIKEARFRFLIKLPKKLDEARFRHELTQQASFFKLKTSISQFSFEPSLLSENGTSKSPQSIKEVIQLEKNYSASLSFLKNFSFFEHLKSHGIVSDDECKILLSIWSRLQERSLAIVDQFSNSSAQKFEIYQRIMQPANFLKYVEPHLDYAKISSALITKIQVFAQTALGKKLFDDFVNSNPSLLDPLTAVTKPVHHLIYLKQKLEVICKNALNAEIKTNLTLALAYAENCLEHLNLVT